jgi:hypothetical protein
MRSSVLLMKQAVPLTAPHAARQDAGAPGDEDDDAAEPQPQNEAEREVEKLLASALILWNDKRCARRPRAPRAPPAALRPPPALSSPAAAPGPALTPPRPRRNFAAAERGAQRAVERARGASEVRPFFLATAATALADMLGNRERLPEAADALRTAFHARPRPGADRA